MHRRGLAQRQVTLIATLLFTALIVLAEGIGPVGSTIAQAGNEPAPPVTVSDFYPEDSNLSDCLGLVERPGCGSESRGGWAQTAVFSAMALGLAIVFFNVVRGVRRNRTAARPSEQNATRTPPDSAS